MRARAAVLWGLDQPWKVQEIDVDPPKRGEVLVRWKAAGLCHSDEHLVTGDMVPSPEMLTEMGLDSFFPIIGAEHVLELLPKGTHEYARFIRPSELAGWCRAAGVDPVASRGLQYNSLTERYRLSDDTSVNYLVACRKPA